MRFPSPIRPCLPDSITPRYAIAGRNDHRSNGGKIWHTLASFRHHPENLCRTGHSHRHGDGNDPAPSPDGTKIAFTRWSSGEIGALWIYDLTTGTEWQVLGEMYEPKSPTWSVDGTQIVINYQHGGGRPPGGVQGGQRPQ